MQYREKIRSLDVSSLSMHADLRSRAAFEEVSMRASGQLVREVKSWLSVVNLSLDAWRQLDQKVFQSAWLLCGYFGEEHFAKYQGSGVSSVTFDDAMKILSSPFGPLKGTPQRCTVFEWQVQACCLFYRYCTVPGSRYCSTTNIEAGCTVTFRDIVYFITYRSLTWNLWTGGIWRVAIDVV